MVRFPDFIWICLRPLARLYWRWRRPLTMGARGLVRDIDGRVLLVRHTYVSGWYLPGGGVERSETALNALRRELDEEAGVILKSRPRFVGLYANFREFKSDHVALFAVEPGEYERVPRRSFEIAEAVFFAPDQLPAETTPSTRARIREVAEGLSAPDMW
jgi:8-oxo-dGTP pyrophosphatase MutT (NUDIX family)